MADLITYSTSEECAANAGLPLPLSDNDRPPRDSIDGWREDAYSMIGEWVGYGTPDQNGVLKRIEKALVKIEILNIINGTSFIMALSPEQEDTLRNFPGGDGILISSFEPGQNT